MNFADVSLMTTADGSHSLLLNSTGEHYHSQFGALTESLYVFVKQGLEAKDYKQNSLDLLEVGFGTGLNAALAMGWARDKGIALHYTGLEPFPVPEAVFSQLNYSGLHPLAASHAALQQHYSDLLREETLTFSDSSLRLVNKPLLNFNEEKGFDLVFYDAFSPTTQEDMWTEAAVARIVSLMRPGAILVTYCIRAYIRRSFMALGCKAEKLPGPPRKREMLRISKPLYV
jgi:tRNA U34 5-methylaminomethyl-2-thiouridine-forming methyltransferase MnmC